MGEGFRRFVILSTAASLIFLVFYIPHASRKPRGPFAVIWPPNQSRHVRDFLRPGTNSSNHAPAHVCTSPETTPLLLVIVCSAVRNFEARHAIRRTWGRNDTKNDAKVLFLLGELEGGLNNTIQEYVDLEVELYGDIIQERFVDSYVNLTIKSLFLLQWFTNHCDFKSEKVTTKYLLKTDDDMYLNIDTLMTAVRAKSRKLHLLMGNLICNAIPIKDPYNKWYVPQYMFGGKTYPNYLSGTGYLMDRLTARKLFQSSFNIPIFHLEDIYITGILAAKARIKPEDNIYFSYVKRKMKNACLFDQTITSHRVNPKEINLIHENLSNLNRSTCGKVRTRSLREHGPSKCKWSRMNNNRFNLND